MESKIAELMKSYLIAGISVMSDADLSEYPSSPFKYDLTIYFHKRTDQTGKIVYLREDIGLRLLIERDGRYVYAERISEAYPVDYGLFVRAILPYVLPLQAIVVLHAMAFENEGAITAVIGESGVGKSTLGNQLIQTGIHVISDDLLPVVFDETSIYAYRNAKLPLRKIIFLQRDPRVEMPSAITISSFDLMTSLLKHGFSELRHTEIWKENFRVYELIARSCKGVSLTIPDNLEKISNVVETVIKET